MLAESPKNALAREVLGRYYTRLGLFQKALTYLTPTGYWSALNYAFCLDALGKREEAVAIYKKLAEQMKGTTVAVWAELGLQKPTWPKDIDTSAEAGEVRLLPDSHWQATASANSDPTMPMRAIDNNRVTRWSTPGKGHGQTPGEWFRLDFDSPISIKRIVLDHQGQETYFYSDWARGLEAEITADGVNWQKAAITTPGPMTFATIKFPSNQLIKAVKFTTTATHDPEWWSIYEIYVFSEKE